MLAEQARLCICGRSRTLPQCDGSHVSEDWTCATGSEAVRFAFCAARRYGNLARKLAAHYQGVTCLRGEPCAASEVLVILIDGTDLDLALEIHANAQSARKIVVSLGVDVGLLGDLFPGSETVDLSEVDPLHAFNRLTAWLDSGEVGTAAESAEVGRRLSSAFLSHAVADEPLILPVKSFLQTYYQADIFTCADSINPGSEWQGEIMRALRRRERFIFALSEASLASHFCSFELGVAAALERPISIVSLDGSLPPVFIQHLQAVDVERIQRSRAWLDKADVLLEELLKILVLDNPTVTITGG